MYYFYDNANRNKEMEAYEYAMQSSDPMVLQSYLDTYKDADEAHRDSIMAHLELSEAERPGLDQRRSKRFERSSGGLSPEVS